jgi:hypothetical protein
MERSVAVAVVVEVVALIDLPPPPPSPRAQTPHTTHAPRLSPTMRTDAGGSPHSSQTPRICLGYLGGCVLPCHVGCLSAAVSSRLVHDRLGPFSFESYYIL